MTGYLVERCQGAGCTNFAQIGTTTGTTYNDTGLTASTSYSYRVRATDAAGNLSPYSNVASATTQPDTQPPTAPSESDGDGGERESDQSELDGIDGQRGSDGVSGGALPGRGMQHLRADWDHDRDDVQRHGADGEHQLQLPGASDGCGGESELLLERGQRYDANPGHATADGAERI